jgi:hypothetical protein
MLNHCRLLTVMATLGFVGSFASADIVFQDNFEGYPGASGWFPAADWTDDYDPGTPPVGPAWITNESAGVRNQVVAHPQNLTPATTGYPEFAAFEGSKYLHFNQSPTYTDNISWASLPATPQSSLTLDVRTFGLSGHDGWHSGLRIVGYGSAATLGTDPAFDIRLLEAGSFTDGTVQTRGAGGIVTTVPGLVHNVNTWEHLTIEADLTTDTFSLTLDGVTVPGLTWAGGDLSAIQSVAFMTANNIGDRRGGVDALTISTVVPEPASAGVVALAGLALAVRRR